MWYALGATSACVACRKPPLAQARGIDIDISFTFILRRHMPREGVDKLSMFAQ